MSQRFMIVPMRGYAPEVGRLVCAMEQVRSRTLSAVAGLTTAQLDHQHDEKSNSIGALLMHIAAVESLHAILSFEARRPTPDELGKWGAAFGLGDAARATIKGRPLEYYLEILSRVREANKARLLDKPDGWLLDERDYIEGERTNNGYIWFHIPEDETNHRGQITWLRKRLPAV